MHKQQLSFKAGIQNIILFYETTLFLTQFPSQKIICIAKIVLFFFSLFVAHLDEKEAEPQIVS